MKGWKFVALCAFVLVSGELILYGRYYILFYKPHGPFKLIRPWHSLALGKGAIEWEDERFGWYYTVQYVGNDTLENIRITYFRDWYRQMKVENIPLAETGIESRFTKLLLPGETFTIRTELHETRVTISYHKMRIFWVTGTAFETDEEIIWELDADDALEKILADA